MLLKYIIKRILLAIPTLLGISFIIFAIIDLPEGSYLDTKRAMMELDGGVNEQEVQKLREDYHIDDPMVVRYAYWISNFMIGELGDDFDTGRPVADMIGDLILPTMSISIVAIFLTWMIAVPLGVFVAIKKNSSWDYSITLVGLIAMATPGFLIALIFQICIIKYIPNFDPTGLQSSRYIGLSLFHSGEVFMDFLLHLLIPAYVLSIAGTAGMIRILRANMVDEMKKLYVLCARARGVHPIVVVMRYPFRVAINPFISGIGGILPAMISGSAVLAIVLSLPTLGPKLLDAIMSQNTYVACSILFIQSILGVIGVLLSDLLLSVVDPRIKFDSK